MGSGVEEEERHQPRPSTSDSAAAEVGGSATPRGGSEVGTGRAGAKSARDVADVEGTGGGGGGGSDDGGGGGHGAGNGKDAYEDSDLPAELAPGPEWAPFVSIYPPEMDFGKKPLCSLHKANITIFNTHANESLTLMSLTTDSVPFQPLDFAPVAVGPKSRYALTVTYLPRALGPTHGTFMLLTSKGSFIIVTRGVGENSPYQVQPLLGAQVPTGVRYIWKLDMHNPHSKMISVLEVVSSDRFMSLAPPAVEGEVTQRVEKGGKLSGKGGELSGKEGTQAAKVAGGLEGMKKNSTEEKDGTTRTFFPRAAWELPGGATKTMLVVNLLTPRPGRYDGTIRMKLKIGGKEEESSSGAEVVELRVPVQVDASPNGVFFSPDQVDFGVSTRRLDRLKQSVTLFNGGPRSVHITDVSSRPADPSLRMRYTRGEVLPPYMEVPGVTLTYSGRLEGIRMGTLLIRTNNSNEAMEVPYRARVLHGKLGYKLEETAFLSPDRGKRPFEMVSHTMNLVNNFPVPLQFFNARVVGVAPKAAKGELPPDPIMNTVSVHASTREEALAKLQAQMANNSAAEAAKAAKGSSENCCFEVKGFLGGQVVPAGHPIAPFRVEFTPQTKRALFTATLELESNLTTLEVPIEVHHGRVVCFDAEQAHARARAAAEAAAIAAASVVPSDGGAASEGATGTAATAAAREMKIYGVDAEEGASVAIPCRSGKTKRGVGNSTLEMGVVDFGVVGVPATRNKRIAVTNPNPVPLTITSVTSTVRSVHATKIEVSGTSLKVPALYESLPPPGCMTTKDNMVLCKQDLGQVSIPPQHIAVVEIRALIDQEEMATRGELTFTLDNGRTFVAPVVLHALAGEIDIVGTAPAPASAASDSQREGLGGTANHSPLPSLTTFPGRVVRTPLRVRSTFAVPVSVTGFSSSDPTVRLDVTATTLQPRKETIVGDVVFDPSLLPADMAYTRLGKQSAGSHNSVVPGLAPAKLGLIGGLWGGNRGSREVPGSRAEVESKGLGRFNVVGWLDSPLASQDIDELKRAHGAWVAAVASRKVAAEGVGRGEKTMSFTLKTDAVDAIDVSFVSKLMRPKLMMFTMIDSVKSESVSEGKDSAEKGVVDFGSAQVGMDDGKRWRVMIVNPLTDAPLCVSLLPLINAAGKKKGGRHDISDVDPGAIALNAAKAHISREYSSPDVLGFTFEKSELMHTVESWRTEKKRRGATAGHGNRGAMGGALCLEPSQSVSLGTLAFSPKEARAYAAHICLRNNLTTLECATLHGTGDAVKVYLAKKYRGVIVVSNIIFRLSKSGDSASSDAITQTVHIVNKGTVPVEIGKPRVGGSECGLDGAYGYTIQPCKPFKLAPGGSKQITVICLTDKARELAGHSTPLTLEVVSPKGVKTTLKVKLSTSQNAKTGAYSAEDMGQLPYLTGPVKMGSSFSWLFGMAIAFASSWALGKMPRLSLVKEVKDGKCNAASGKVNAGKRAVGNADVTAAQVKTMKTSATAASSKKAVKAAPLQPAASSEPAPATAASENATLPASPIMSSEVSMVKAVAEEASAEIKSSESLSVNIAKPAAEAAGVDRAELRPSSREKESNEKNSQVPLPRTSQNGKSTPFSGSGSTMPPASFLNGANSSASDAVKISATNATKKTGKSSNGKAVAANPKNSKANAALVAKGDGHLLGGKASAPLPSANFPPSPTFAAGKPTSPTVPSEALAKASSSLQGIPSPKFSESTSSGPTSPRPPSPRVIPKPKVIAIGAVAPNKVVPAPAMTTAVGNGPTSTKNTSGGSDWITPPKLPTDTTTSALTMAAETIEAKSVAATVGTGLGMFEEGGWSSTVSWSAGGVSQLPLPLGRPPPPPSAPRPVDQPLIGSSSGTSRVPPLPPGLPPRSVSSSASAFGFAERKGANVTPLDLGGRLGRLGGGMGVGGSGSTGDGSYNMWAENFSQFSASAGAVGTPTTSASAGAVGTPTIFASAGAVGPPPSAGSGSFGSGGGGSVARNSPNGSLQETDGISPSAGAGAGNAFNTSGLPSFFGFTSSALESDALEPLGSRSTDGNGLHRHTSATYSELGVDTAEWAENNKDLLDGLDLDD